MLGHRFQYLSALAGALKAAVDAIRSPRFRRFANRSLFLTLGFLRACFVLCRQAREQSQLTAVTTKTTNVHGDEITVTTTSQYEQQTFSSKTDWRVRNGERTNRLLVYLT